MPARNRHPIYVEFSVDLVPQNRRPNKLIRGPKNVEPKALYLHQNRRPNVRIRGPICSFVVFLLLALLTLFAPELQ